jgi:uncharacterized protein (TIGR00730 family)
MERVCVFCGSSHGARPLYAEAATELGRELARRGLELVYGGGNVGLMGVVADAVLDAGGRAHGVIPAALEGRELAHQRLTALDVTPSMHARKARMVELSDAFVALPGGFGTFDELFEVMTWSQLGIHERPIGVLDVNGYFAPLRALIDRAIGEGFVKPEFGELVVMESTPGALLDRLATHRPPSVRKWADLKQS